MKISLSELHLGLSKSDLQPQHFASQFVFEVGFLFYANFITKRKEKRKLILCPNFVIT